MDTDGCHLASSSVYQWYPQYRLDYDSIGYTPFTPKGKREKLKTTLKSNLHKQTVVEHAFFWPTRAIQTVLFLQRVILHLKRKTP